MWDRFLPRFHALSAHLEGQEMGTAIPCRDRLIEGSQDSWLVQWFECETWTTCTTYLRSTFNCVYKFVKISVCYYWIINRNSHQQPSLLLLLRGKWYSWWTYRLLGANLFPKESRPLLWSSSLIDSVSITGIVSLMFCSSSIQLWAPYAAILAMSTQ